ncbi:MAG TPA: hypothetical protein VNP94_03335 [Actinomycetota bacterium]|nr:hypothetical protein [Actinomycetota bacterium]
MPSRRGLAALLALGLLLGAGGGTTYAAFSSLASNAGNSFSAAPDLVAPAASASVIAKTSGYLAGAIRQGGTFYVYANVADDGNPPAGVASVTADVSAVSAGATAVPLVAGSYSVEGVAYGYRSASLSADPVLPEGTYAYSLTLTDAAGNSATQTGFSVLVDDTPPAGVDVQTANGGATPGRAEAGDTVTLTFSERIDPGSVLGGWDGTATAVQVRIVNAGSSDTLQVRAAGGSPVLPLGTVALGGDYVAGTRNFNGSTMVQAGTAVVLTLGTPSGGTRTVAVPTSMAWTPSPGATDAAGNATLTATVAESAPPLDMEF